MTCPLINKEIEDCTGCPHYRLYESEREPIKECKIEKFEDSPWMVVALIMRHLDFNEGLWR